MSITGLTLDDLFSTITPSRHITSIRTILTRNNITDVDRLRTVSIEQLIQLSPKFEYKTVSEINESLRMLGVPVIRPDPSDQKRYSNSNRSRHGVQRCQRVYGANRETPLAMAAFHYYFNRDSSSQQIVKLILQGSPDMRLHHLAELDRKTVVDQIDAITHKRSDVDITDNDWRKFGFMMHFWEVAFKDDHAHARV